jgi:hypothetical protein
MGFCHTGSFLPCCMSLGICLPRLRMTLLFTWITTTFSLLASHHDACHIFSILHPTCSILKFVKHVPFSLLEFPHDRFSPPFTSDLHTQPEFLRAHQKALTIPCRRICVDLHLLACFVVFGWRKVKRPQKFCHRQKHISFCEVDARAETTATPIAVMVSVIRIRRLRELRG